MMALIEPARAVGGTNDLERLFEAQFRRLHRGGRGRRREAVRGQFYDQHGSNGTGE
jgi:hypothetical protein